MGEFWFAAATPGGDAKPEVSWPTSPARCANWDRLRRPVIGAVMTLAGTPKAFRPMFKPMLVAVVTPLPAMPELGPKPIPCAANPPMVVGVELEIEGGAAEWVT